MDINTFGNTPAAEYLASVLTSANNKALTKSVTRRIMTTNATVSSLINAFREGHLPAKVLGNVLRVLRDEVSRDSQDTLVDQLCANVRIGYIKRGIRHATLGNKAEIVMRNPEKRATEIVPCVWGTAYMFRDNVTNQLVRAGMKRTCEETRVEKDFIRVDVKEIDLKRKAKRRAAKRNLSLGKPHMLIEGGFEHPKY